MVVVVVGGSLKSVVRGWLKKVRKKTPPVFGLKIFSPATAVLCLSGIGCIDMGVTHTHTRHSLILVSGEGVIFLFRSRRRSILFI